MGDPSLDMAVEVGMDDYPANAIGKGTFVVNRNCVLGKMIVEYCSPFTNEVRRARDMTSRALSEATFSETSTSVDHCEVMRIVEKIQRNI